MLAWNIFNTLAHTELDTEQELITRSLQLLHIPVTAFPQTDLFLVWIYVPVNSKTAQPLPRGKPRGIWLFWKILVKFPAMLPFWRVKCPTR